MRLNKYNLIDCNKLCKLAIRADIWDELHPMLKDCVVNLDDVKYVSLVKKRKVVD